MADQIGTFTSSSVGTAAVRATATGAEGSGVFASSSAGNGILSISTLAGNQPIGGAVTPGGSGVIGENGQFLGVGVTETAVGESGVGVQGNAQNGWAVQGTATSGIGVSAVSGSGIALLVTSKGLFGAPQVQIAQALDEFARIRMGTSVSIVNTTDGAIEGLPGPWDIASGGPNGVLNLYAVATATNVLSASSNGNVTISGSLHQHSSRSLKENIRDLSYADAIAAFKDLSPVQYQLRNDHSRSPHLGFVAEDMPDLIAAPDRKTVCQMDIVAILTKVLHQLRLDNLDLLRRIGILENS